MVCTGVLLACGVLSHQVHHLLLSYERSQLRRAVLHTRLEQLESEQLLRWISTIQFFVAAAKRAQFKNVEDNQHVTGNQRHALQKVPAVCMQQPCRNTLSRLIENECTMPMLTWLSLLPCRFQWGSDQSCHRWRGKLSDQQMRARGSTRPQVP